MANSVNKKSENLLTEYLRCLGLNDCIPLGWSAKVSGIKVSGIALESCATRASVVPRVLASPSQAPIGRPAPHARRRLERSSTS